MKSHAERLGVQQLENLKAEQQVNAESARILAYSRV